MAYSADKHYSVTDTYQEAGIELSSRKRAGEVTTTCPQCSHTRKKPKDPCLSVNLDKAKWKCWNCQWAGRLKDESDRLAEAARAERPHREFVRPKLVNHSPYSDRLLNWFEQERGLSRATLEHFQVGEALEWMPQQYQRHFKVLLEAGTPEEEARREASRLAKVNTIQFPYFVNGELINIKFRTARKEFKLAKDAQLVFFNLDSVNTPAARYVIIVEGELDAMTWHQAGYPQVISVPNGAALSKEERTEYEKTGRFNDANALQLEYLDNCWEALEHLETIYVAGDMDAPGQKLRAELIRRFGTEKCRTIEYQGYKDANELAIKTGSALNLQACFEAARAIPEDNLFTVDSEMQALLDFYDNGLPEGMPIGIDEFEGHFSIRSGELTCVTGVPGDGKTSFIIFLAVLLSIRFGWKWLIHSPENYPAAKLFARMAQIVGGLSISPKSRNRMSREKYIAVLQDHIATHFFMVDSNRLNNHPALRELTEKCVRRFGIRGMLLDPWNDIEELGRKGADLTEYVTAELSAYRRTIRLTGVHLFINAHPRTLRKTEAGNTAYPVAQAPDIYGGGAWWNRADNILCVHRPRLIEANGSEDLTTDVHVHKIKEQDLVGKPTGPDNPVQLTYEPTTGRYHGKRTMSTIYDFQDTAVGINPPTLQEHRDARMLPLRQTPGFNEFEPELVVTEQGNLFGQEYAPIPMPPLAAGIDPNEDPPF